MEEEKKKNFMYELAVVTCSKDESLYLLEWIEFYRLMGVDHIYFYDNGSTDDTKALLKPYVDMDYVTYTYIDGRGKQLEAYNDALVLGKEKCRWMAFIDMDEYIVPIDSNRKILDVINDIIGGQMQVQLVLPSTGLPMELLDMRKGLKVLLPIIIRNAQATLIL